MSQHYILCFDGTWNEPAQEDDGVRTLSNVAITWQALTGNSLGSTFSPENLIQDAPLKVDIGQACYLVGVGTVGSVVDEIIGGMTGAGMAARIQAAYAWLAARWMPGDRVSLFGFSRGAYAARSFAGMLDRCGLPGVNAAAVNAQKIYAENYLRKNRPAGYNAVSVAFIGLWDTVAMHLAGVVEAHELNPKNVVAGLHALALDEHRESFVPSFWRGHSGVREVWFAGAHTNVGGGYADFNASNIPLFHILGEFRNKVSGMDISPNTCSELAPLFDAEKVHNLRNSYVEFLKLPRFLSSFVESIGVHKCVRAARHGQFVHKSVIEASMASGTNNTATYKTEARYADGMAIDHNLNPVHIEDWNWADSNC